MPPFFRHASSLEHDTGFGHPERADRIRAIEARARAAATGSAASAVEAPAATEEQLLRGAPGRATCESVREHSRARRGVRPRHAHEPGLVRGRAAAPPAARARWPRRCSAAASAPASRALRPPGHHAERATRDGLLPVRQRGGRRAARARRARAPSGCWSLDWDVHHGNGTNAIFHDSREVLFVSIHQWPFWPGTGPLDGRRARATARATRSTCPCRRAPARRRSCR